MLKVNLFDNDFRHIEFSIPGKRSSNIEYIRDQYKWDGITLFTNDMMFSNVVDEVDSFKKIGWLLEPKVIKPEIYEHIFRVEHKFDYILTHDNDLLSFGTPSKYKFAPVGGCWIKEENYKIWPKDKLISIIASSKNFTVGQQLRHDIIKRYRGDLDIFGGGYNPIENKEDGLAHHRFSVVVENCSVDGYFTEKLLDCFALGTVPIYWGCKNIEDFFDVSGILRFNSSAEFDILLGWVNKMGKDIYDSMRDSILDNFNKSRDYEITEDWIYNNILKDL